MRSGERWEEILALFRLRYALILCVSPRQSINTGSDVAGNQFDLQMGAGGAGMFDVCAGASASMYEGPMDVWGCVYGGIDNATACHALPVYPRVNPKAMQDAGDTLVDLCVASFKANVRPRHHQIKGATSAA